MSIRGRVAPDATKLKLIKARNTRGPVSEETKRKIGLAHKGKIRTLEDRQKQCASVMGSKNHMHGDHHTSETKQ